MDVLCQAKSGMGKTAVFVLSTLHQLEAKEEAVGSLVRGAPPQYAHPHDITTHSTCTCTCHMHMHMPHAHAHATCTRTRTAHAYAHAHAHAACAREDVSAAILLPAAVWGPGATAAPRFNLTPAHRVRRARAVQVLCHTRELAYQICNEFERFSRYLPDIKTKVFYGGVPVAEHKRILKSECPHIIVGTPGRVLQLVREKELATKGISARTHHHRRAARSLGCEGCGSLCLASGCAGGQRHGRLCGADGPVPSPTRLRSPPQSTSSWTNATRCSSSLTCAGTCRRSSRTRRTRSRCARTVCTLDLP